MLTILERLRAHCFPTTYKTHFISKPEQHHRMIRHQYCPCNISWIELYAFFCQTLLKLQLVSRCGRVVVNTWRQQFFYTPSPCTQQQIKFSKQDDWRSWMEFFILLRTWMLLCHPAKYSQKCRPTSEQSIGRQKPLNCLYEGLLVNYKSDCCICYFAVHFWDSLCFTYF